MKETKHNNNNFNDNISRLDILKDKQERLKQKALEAENQYRDFINLGKEVYKTPEGRKFFLKARDLFEGELIRIKDDYNNVDKTYLQAKVDGELHMLNKLIIDFINIYGRKDND